MFVLLQSRFLHVFQKTNFKAKEPKTKRKSEFKSCGVNKRYTSGILVNRNDVVYATFSDVSEKNAKVLKNVCLVTKSYY